MPSLEAAFLLTQLYRAPLRSLFYGYFEKCKRLFEERSRNLSKSGVDIETSEYCSIEERLNQTIVTQIDLQKIHSHTATLVRRRAERMNHLSS
jgi:hypothetical protein